MVIPKRTRKKINKMKKFNKIRRKIFHSMEEAVDITGDLSDIGNEIGLIVGKYIDKDNTAEDFIRGLRHGISLVDDTHDKTK